MTECLATIMYDSVVKHEIVRLALMIDSFNDLEVMVAYVFNAYITTPITKKCGSCLTLNRVPILVGMP